MISMRAATLTFVVAVTAAGVSCVGGPDATAPVVDGGRLTASHRGGTAEREHERERSGKQGREPGAWGWGRGGGGGGTSRKGEIVPCIRREALYNSAVIGPEGGVLRVGRNRLVVPAGALQEAHTITGYVPPDTMALVRFEPSGLTFDRPATLIVDVRGCADPGPQPDMAYLDDSAQVVEQLPARHDAPEGVVAAEIAHFSGYAVAW